MGWRCCATNCKSGYDSQPAPHSQGISFHRFPHNKQLAKVWLRKLCRDGYVLGSNSRVCSLHFPVEAFQRFRADSNVSRRQRQSKLRTKRRLKPDAVPRFYFENLPDPNERNRAEEEMALQEAVACGIKKELEEEPKPLMTDAVKHLDDIEMHFCMCDDFASSSDINMLRKEDSLLISIIELKAARTPLLSATLLIERDLSFSISLFGKPYKVRRISERLFGQKRFRKFSDVLMVVQKLKKLVAEKAEIPWLDMAIGCLTAFIAEKQQNLARAAADPRMSEEQEQGTIKRCRFFRDQLSYEAKQSLGRRYTGETLALADTIFSSNKATYEAVINLDLLTLPSGRTLRKLAQDARDFPIPKALLEDRDISRHLSPEEFLEVV